MQQLIECVPNFSEGRNLELIHQITDEIEKSEGVNLLDVDPGATTNRTVVTFVGTPECVVEAAFKAIKKAQEQSEHGPLAGAIGWFGDFNAMALKTVVRKVLSWGPMSIELQNAIANDEDYDIPAEQKRDEENAAPRQVINVDAVITPAEPAAEGSPVEEQPEDKPDF